MKKPSSAVRDTSQTPENSELTRDITSSLSVSTDLLSSITFVALAMSFSRLLSAESSVRSRRWSPKVGFSLTKVLSFSNASSSLCSPSQYNFHAHTGKEVAEKGLERIRGRSQVTTHVESIDSINFPQESSLRQAPRAIASLILGIAPTLNRQFPLRTNSVIWSARSCLFALRSITSAILKRNTWNNKKSRWRNMESMNLILIHQWFF